MAQPAKKKKYIMSRVRTREVSLVDRGAVDRTFCLQKNEGEPVKKEILEACLSAPIDDEEGLNALLAKAETDPKAAEVITAALRLLTAFKDLLRPADLQLLESILSEQPLSEEAATEATEMQDKAEPEKPAEQKTEQAQKSARANGATPMPPEALAKFEEIAKARAQAEERVTRLEKQLEEREEADKLRVCIAKAQEQFPHLGPAKDVGQLLRKLESAGLDKDVEEMLRGANSRAQSSALFSEYGMGAHLTKSDDDPSAKLARKAEAIRKEQNVSLAKAHVMACEQNPDLYEAADKSKRGR
jgi:hypothetical protein